MINISSKKLSNINKGPACCILESIIYPTWKIESYINFRSFDRFGNFEKDILYTCFMFDGDNCSIKTNGDVRKYDKYFIHLIKDPKNTPTKDKRACFSFLKDDR